MRRSGLPPRPLSALVLALAVSLGASSGAAGAAATAVEPTEPDARTVTHVTTIDDIATVVVDDLAGARTPRLAGASRYETAVAISMRAFGDRARVVYIARGDRVGDALAGGALSDGPVLLVPPTGIAPPPVRAEITRLQPDRVIALGGPAAVSDAVVRSAAQGRPTSRLAGPDAASTAAAIAVHAFPDGADEVYLARTGESPDAVAGSALSQGPVLAVPTSGPVPAATRAAVNRLSPRAVVALGGPAAVSEPVLRGASSGRGTARLAGADRYTTSTAIAAHAYPDGARVAYLASGTTLADAVAGGALTDGPILLTPPPGSPLTGHLGATLERLGVRSVGVLGGPTAVPDRQVSSVLAAAPSVRPGPLPGGFGGSTGPEVGLTCANVIRSFRPIPLDARVTLRCGSFEQDSRRLGVTEAYLGGTDGSFLGARITIRSDLVGDALLATIAHELAHAWSYAHLTPAQQRDFARSLGQSDFLAGDYGSMPAEVWARSHAACTGYPDGFGRRQVGCDVLARYGWVR